MPCLPEHQTSAPCINFLAPTPNDHACLSLLLALTAINVLTAQVNIGNMMPKPGSSKGVSVEDDKSPFVPNSFIGSFRMENHMFSKGVEEKNSPTTMRYWSSAEMTMTKMEMPDAKGQDMRMLTDLKGKWQYMMMVDEKGKKTAMKSKKKTIGAG
ncbi:MAG: hypothetical protein IPP26_12750 [Flavobacteriales bacterium]|nr:hypothetical protein [Flavobacteriales bacterium]